MVIVANPWQNSPNQYDVNNDDGVSPLDALLLINYINAQASPPIPLPLPKPAGYPFYDVERGRQRRPHTTCLLVINEINRLNTQLGGEGEGDAASRTVASARNSHLDDVLRNDETWLDIVEDVNRSLGSRLAVDAIFADLGA